MNRDKKSAALLLIEDESIEIPDIEELNKMLSDEIGRDSPDYDLIDEITQLIMEKKGLESNVSPENGISAIKRRSLKHRHGKRAWKFALTAAASILIMGNVITVNAKGESFLAAIIEQTRQQIDFNFRDDHRFSGEGSQTYDPYGIKQQCEEYGFIPEAPMYLPEELSYSVSDMTDMNDNNGSYFKFTFTNQLSSFTALYFVYSDPENMNEIGIKNEVKEYSEITVNDHSAVFAAYKTGYGTDFYGLTYRKGNVIANFFFEQISDDEIDKIIQSIE
ncbi:MAG: DUF4367 domain-containing protein [Ruminococcus sp.]|nr:DUF4367 domain-containing protein [Ruminococcus sp.]